MRERVGSGRTLFVTVSELLSYEGEKRRIIGSGGMLFDVERTESGLSVLGRPRLEGAHGEQFFYGESGSISFPLFFTYSRQKEGYQLDEGQAGNGVFSRGQKQSAVVFAEVTQKPFKEDPSLNAFLYLVPNLVPDQAVENLFEETRLHDPIELQELPFNPVAVEFTDLKEVSSQITDEKLDEKIKPIAERALTQREALVASQGSFPLAVEKLLTASGRPEFSVSLPAFLLTKLVEQSRTNTAVGLLHVEDVLKIILGGVKVQGEKWALASFFCSLFGREHCLVSSYDQCQENISELAMDLLAKAGTLSSDGSKEAIWREGFSGMTRAAFTYWLKRQWLEREEKKLFTKRGFFYAPLRETHEPLDGELFRRWINLANKAREEVKHDNIDWLHLADKLAELALMGKFYPDGNIHFFHWGFGVENGRYAGDRGLFSREIYLLVNPNGVRLVLPLPSSAVQPATVEINWDQKIVGWREPELCLYYQAKLEAPFDYTQAAIVSFERSLMEPFENLRRTRIPLGQKRGGDVEAWTDQGWKIVKQLEGIGATVLMGLLPSETRVAVKQYFKIPANYH